MSPWIPLESNPEVFNEWATKAGLVESAAKFQDVYGLDAELLGMVQGPVKAVLLLFPITDKTETIRKADEEQLAVDENQKLVDPTLMFIKQTIPNACGTIGLLHALTNSDLTFTPNSTIQNFIVNAIGKSPAERAKLLETMTAFANIHKDTASRGQTKVPTDLDTDLHFTCFVSAPSAARRAKAGMQQEEEDEDEADGSGAKKEEELKRIVELDGRRDGPVDRGVCNDLLTDVARIVKEKYIAQSASAQFSMVALGGGPETN